MKKVLILAAVFALAAGQAWALSSVVNSKHNMTAIPGDSTNSATGTTEVCVFCHTPHGAATDNPNAPLWNRSDSAGQITSIYNSATLNTLSKGATVLGRVNNSDAPLCLSCHIAGKIESTALNNPPNGVTITFGAAPFIIEATDQTDIGVDLSNDHPIGMIYNSVAADTASEGVGFNTFAEVTGNGTIKFYPNVAATGVMWCSSCHDVHDDSNYPFLATGNTGSGLCLKCHNK